MNLSLDLSLGFCLIIIKNGMDDKKPKRRNQCDQNHALISKRHLLASTNDNKRQMSFKKKGDEKAIFLFLSLI